MKEKPILFSARMVRAILEGRKTQTRRIVKPQPITWHHDERGFEFKRTDEHRPVFADTFARNYSPYGQPGDRLWVKEKSRVESASSGKNPWYSIAYAAGGPSPSRHGELPAWYPKQTYKKDGTLRWQPSIFMPRWASRITLEIKDVRVERLQDISEADSIAEGVDLHGPVGNIVEAMKSPGVYHFANLWESINGRGSWDANPWVWVVEFVRVEDKTATMKVGN